MLYQRFYCFQHFVALSGRTADPLWNVGVGTAQLLGAAQPLVPDGARKDKH